MYLLNISIDFQHPRAPLRVDTSINEIESLAELLVEEVGQLKDFFQEIPESDREPIMHINFSLMFIISNPLVLPVPAGIDLQSDFPECKSAFPRLTPAIVTPPPQIVWSIFVDYH